MRNCPQCHVPMNVQTVLDTQLDFCPRCSGVFLDADEGHVVGMDTNLFFGFSSRNAGPSTRICPDHGEAMTCFVAETPTGPLSVERAGCCGGIFLDAGEATQVASAGQAAAAPRAGGQAPAGKACPTCHTMLDKAPLHGCGIDECKSCDHIFFDGGEAEQAGIDTAALFGGEAWSAKSLGPDGPCPACGQPMERFEAQLLGPPVMASFASCCGGVWVARSEEPRLRAAARRAVSERADQQYSSGQKVTATAAQRTPEEQRASQAALAAHQHVVARHQMLDAIEVLRVEQREMRYGSALGFSATDTWDD